MVRRSRRTTLGDATFALSPPWSLISSWTNSRFLSARSAFAFSIPATMATGQKRGRLSGGGAKSAGAGVSGMTASQVHSNAGDREVHPPTAMEDIAARRQTAQAPLARPDAARDRLAVAGVIPACRPIPLERGAFFRGSSTHGHDASLPRVTMTRLPVTDSALPFDRLRKSSKREQREHCNDRGREEGRRRGGGHDGGRGRAGVRDGR